MNIIYSERALSHLRGIKAYLIENAPAYVSHVLDGLLNKIESLNKLPLRGRPTPELLKEGGDVREIYFDPYRISYLIDDDTIFILAVQHQRQKRMKYKNRDID